MSTLETLEHVWNRSRINSENTRMTFVTSFCCSYCKLWKQNSHIICFFHCWLWTSKCRLANRLVNCQKSMKVGKYHRLLIIQKTSFYQCALLWQLFPSHSKTLRGWGKTLYEAEHTEEGYSIVVSSEYLK